ncbi:MAG: collagen binding domain-containing protein [Pyrinomonadaceae bacterium]
MSPSSLHADARTLDPRARRQPSASAFFRLALALFVCALFSASPARAQSVNAGGDAATRNGATRTRGSISVRVLDDAGQPVQNALVTTSRQGQSQRPSFDNSGASSGKYVVSNLEPGLYVVSVGAPGYVLESTAASNDPTDSTALYRPGDSVTMRMTKGGVITGRVTDAEGEPVVGARVVAVRTRDAAGRGAQEGAAVGNASRERRTDDRGVYRLYGLSAGSYVVLAGGKSQFGVARPMPYDADAPTYYPAATRDGAVEVQVQTGQELTGIDIRHRGERGHTISGTLAGALPAAGTRGSLFVLLVNPTTGANESQSFIQNDANPAFSFDSIGDGDYDVIANSFAASDNASFAPPLRVSVRGADVVGLRLTLARLGSLAGHVAFEPLKAADAARPECQSERAFHLSETLVSARREVFEPRSRFTAAQTAPDDKGDFVLRNLRDGRLRFGVNPRDERLYVRAATLPAGTPAPTAAGARGAAPPTTIDLARVAFSLKPSEQLAGASVTVAAGAASLRGRVAVAEGEQLPEALRVYLVPAERERAEDVLRYGETSALSDGTFAFRNLAPGRYLLVARAVEREAGARTQQPRLPLALDPTTRAALRRDAEAAKTSVELQPCQSAEDFALRFTRQ